MAARTVTHGSSEAVWSEEYFDGLGRTYLWRGEGPTGDPIHVLTTFDARGLVAAESSPYFATEEVGWTAFWYDTLGRPRLTLNPDGTAVNVSYGRDRVVVTDERGAVQRYVTDAYGRVVRHQQDNGSETYETTYTYDAAGTLREIENHLGHVTTFTPDTLGWTRALDDPSTGHWTYDYYPSGDLKTQTNAKGETLTFYYDLLGRIQRKAYPGGSPEIVWTYDEATATNGKGRLTRVSGPGAGTSTRLSYDKNGRPNWIERTIDGLAYARSTIYTALDTIKQDACGTDPAVLYTYNDAGWLRSVRVNQGPTYIPLSARICTRGSVHAA